MARQAPTTAVALKPILSLRMPTRKERKKVVPIVREPTKEHLADASSTPLATISFFSSTKRIPNVLMIPKMIPLTRKQAHMTNQAWKNKIEISQQQRASVIMMMMRWSALTQAPPSGGSTLTLPPSCSEPFSDSLLQLLTSRRKNDGEMFHLDNILTCQV